jgi:poly(3-hydroxybutyrate) depolymerase
VFAGGAVIAGLPYRAATDIPGAFQSMSHGHGLTARQHGDLVRAASSHRGPWPTVSVWHGTADTTVHPVNAAELLKQWTDVHGVAIAPSGQDRVDGYPHRVWRNAEGRVVVEEYVITGMTHGTPLATGEGENRYGKAGPYMLEAGISSSYHIAQSWGLTGHVVQERALERRLQPEAAPSSAAFDPFARGGRGGSEHADAERFNVRSVIESALKSAGLMK